MRRTIALIAIVAGVVIASKLLLENWLGISLEPWARAWMADAGWSGAATVVALLAIDIFIPVPSSVVMVLSGAAFGILWGSLLAFVGSIGGEWLGFELARRYGSSWFSRFIGDESERRRLNVILATHGAAAVAATRALPVVMETMSVVAGLSTMSRSTFLAASVVGTAPIVVVYAYAGARSRETGSLVPAIVILIAVAAAGWVWYRASFGERRL
jgi:3-dehydroquinate synthase